MAESQCVASQWDRSGSIVCSFDSLPTIRFCLTLTRHNCANCWPGFWLWASFKIRFYEYFKEWQKLKMETIHIASAWTNECVSRFDLRLGRCRFWIAHCAKPCNAMHRNAMHKDWTLAAIIKDICIVSPEWLSFHLEIIWITCRWKCHFVTFDLPFCFYIRDPTTHQIKEVRLDSISFIDLLTHTLAKFICYIYVAD